MSLNKALQIWERVHGEKHLDVAYVCEKLAKCLQTLGSFRQSLELHKRALSIWDRTVGVNHPNVATTYFNMANILQAEGKIDDALELYRSYSITQCHLLFSCAWSKVLQTNKRDK